MSLREYLFFHDLRTVASSASESPVTAYASRRRLHHPGTRQVRSTPVPGRAPYRRSNDPLIRATLNDPVQRSPFREIVRTRELEIHANAKSGQLPGGRLRRDSGSQVLKRSKLQI
jgi:hypothetical protein